MPLDAVALVLLAAILHPTWNLLAKRATDSDPAAFIWLTSALSALLYVPMVALLAVGAGLRLVNVPAAVGLMFGTGLLHQAYFVLLQRGYRVGAFSIVYPVARGSGPLVAALAAALVLGEGLSALGLLGGAAIVAAIFVVAGKDAGDASAHLGASKVRSSIGFGLATGVAIAAYTLWDKRAVSAFAVAPVFYDFGRTLAQTLLAAPFVFGSARRRSLVAPVWQTYRREVFGVAILSPAAYLLVLYALTIAPVSLVAPMRESSIIIGAFMGARIFNEGGLRRRLIAAALMLAGIVALTRA